MKRGLIALVRGDMDEKSWQTFTNSNLQFSAFVDTNFAGYTIIVLTKVLK